MGERDTCVNCNYTLMPGANPPCHIYGVRRCKRERFDPDAPVGR